MSSRSFALSIAVEAQDDIDAITTYTILEWGDAIASDYLNEIYEALERLTSFPYMGRVLAGFGGSFRRTQCSHHVIYYQIDGTRELISVIRVLHERMDPIGRIT